MSETLFVHVRCITGAHEFFFCKPLRVNSTESRNVILCSAIKRYRICTMLWIKFGKFTFYFGRQQAQIVAVLADTEVFGG